MEPFDIFLGIFIVIIIIGFVILLRRRQQSADQKKASLGMAIGLAVGGNVGLALSIAAQTFVIILPGSVGIGMGAGFLVGALFDSRQSA
jgi:hypothetical protein